MSPETQELLRDVGTNLPDGWKVRQLPEGLIVFVCNHGGKHPAPKCYQPLHIQRDFDFYRHGCDGCCRGQVAPARGHRRPVLLGST